MEVSELAARLQVDLRFPEVHPPRSTVVVARTEVEGGSAVVSYEQRR
jgi:hypothetical protein